MIFFVLGLGTTTMDKNYGKTAKNGVVLDTTTNVKLFLETIWLRLRILGLVSNVTIITWMAT